MADPLQEKFQSYYARELSYLRNAGAIFAQENPKIARRLQVSQHESPDPHVERLLESFAFLTARISQEIDNRVPDVAAALLNTLYPQLVNPIPSASIAHVKADPTKGKLNVGHTVPRGTALFAYGEDNTPCRFQTCYDITLWPLNLVEAAVVPRGDAHIDSLTLPEIPFFIKLTLKTDKVNLEDIACDALQFHIAGDRSLVFHILEDVLAHHETPILASAGHTKPTLILNALKPVGLEAHEMLSPQAPYTTHAYGLIQEYFHFPEKFFFIRIQNLKKLMEVQGFGGDVLTLYLPLKQGFALANKGVSVSNFLLGCTPMVNLFPRTTDPLRIDRRKTFYRLVPDQRRDRTTEIHSVLEVRGTLEGAGDIPIQPYFSLNHEGITNPETVYWVAKRQGAFERGLPGSDTHLSFVDLQYKGQAPAQQIAYARVLCTNRFLAEQIPQGALFNMEDKVPASAITCLYKPGPQVYSPTDGETLWRIISQLSVSHLWLTGREDALNTLKENLRLYAGNAANPQIHDVDMLENLTVRPIVRRINNREAWRGFVEGIALDLSVNAAPFTGSPAFLVAMILREYLSLTVSLNAFIEMNLKSTNTVGNWMRWQPHFGAQKLL